jgi:hypothetical protein
MTTKKLSRPLLSAEEAKTALAVKGWTNRALAEWWDCTEEYVSRVVNNAKRRRWFDDALRSLPQISDAKKKKIEQ